MLKCKLWPRSLATVNLPVIIMIPSSHQQQISKHFTKRGWNHYRWGNWGIRKWVDLLKITQQIHDIARTRTQVFRVSTWFNSDLPSSIAPLLVTSVIFSCVDYRKGLAFSFCWLSLDPRPTSQQPLAPFSTTIHHAIFPTSEDTHLWHLLVLLIAVHTQCTIAIPYAVLNTMQSQPHYRGLLIII